MDKEKLKWHLKEGIKNKSYQQRFHIPCDFPQEQVDTMINEIIDELFPGAQAKVESEDRQLTILDVSVAKRKLCPTCGSDSLITLSDITYCMNDCCDGVKGHN